MENCFEVTCEKVLTEHEYGSPGCSYKICLLHWAEGVVYPASEECPECDHHDPDPDGFKLSLSDLTGPRDELLQAIELTKKEDPNQ
jgi:hypothetical protein